MPNTKYQADTTRFSKVTANLIFCFAFF